MPRIRFEPWLPSSHAVVLPVRGQFRPLAVRTYVRATEGPVHRKRAASGGSEFPLLRRGAAQDRPRAGGWQSSYVQEVHGALGYQHRPFRPGRHPPRVAVPSADPARRDPRRALDVPPRSPEAATPRRGHQATDLRVVRPGSEVARTSSGPRPGSHQRRAGRPPAREPSDRVPELRGDLRHTLRPQEPPGVELPALRRRLRSSAREPALLLGGVWTALESRRRAAAWRTQGSRAAAV
jgi:hypothetical protein